MTFIIKLNKKNPKVFKENGFQRIPLILFLDRIVSLKKETWERLF